MYSSINPYFTLKTRTCLSFICFLFVSFTFSACTGATSRHMAFFYFVSFTFSACTEGIRLVLYINNINFTSTY
jgi:hypothetical protein